MPKLCLSVGNTTLDNIFSDIDYAKAKSVEFLEIRFDLIKETAAQALLNDHLITKKISNLISYSNAHGIKIIGTKRGTENSVRFEFLKSLVEIGIHFVDIELDILERYLIKEFILFASSKNSKVILSVHNNSKPINLRDTIQYYIDSSFFGADFFKIADTANSSEDALNTLEKNQKLARIKTEGSSIFPDFTVFSMGEKGKITRVLSLLYGSSFAYCSSPSGITAPGQIGVDEFRSEYLRLSDAYKF